jgi:hypothetical protein
MYWCAYVMFRALQPWDEGLKNHYEFSKWCCTPVLGADHPRRQAGGPNMTEINLPEFILTLSSVLTPNFKRRSCPGMTLLQTPTCAPLAICPSYTYYYISVHHMPRIILYICPPYTSGSSGSVSWSQDLKTKGSDSSTGWSSHSPSGFVVITFTFSHSLKQYVYRFDQVTSCSTACWIPWSYVITLSHEFSDAATCHDWG